MKDLGSLGQARAAMGRKKTDTSLTSDPIQEALLKARMRAMRCCKATSTVNPEKDKDAGNIHRLGFLE